MNGQELGPLVKAGTAAAPQTNMTKKSCDLCKRMKVCYAFYLGDLYSNDGVQIKCERQDKTCRHCAARKLQCTVTAREKKKRMVKRHAPSFFLVCQMQ